jgi:hypothetical protein
LIDQGGGKRRDGHSSDYGDFRFWHKADIPARAINVRFRVESGHCDFTASEGRNVSIDIRCAAADAALMQRFAKDLAYT